MISIGNEELSLRRFFVLLHAPKHKIKPIEVKTVSYLKVNEIFRIEEDYNRS
jgi:hypothetical protein